MIDLRIRTKQRVASRRPAFNFDIARTLCRTRYGQRGKYYNISPYAYCLNNPVIFVDLDGREVNIFGELYEDVLRQLQSSVGNSITLTMNDKGSLTYTVNTDKELKGNAQSLANMIDDSSITVNLITTSECISSNGTLFFGGLFMGNTVSKDADGNVTVSASQEVNPNATGAADEVAKTPGKLMMHEATEAYEGAKLSKESGVSAPPAGQNAMSQTNSIYRQAHERATPQTPIVHTLYDKDGKKLTDAQISRVVRVDWKVASPAGKLKVVQTYP